MYAPALFWRFCAAPLLQSDLAFIMEELDRCYNRAVTLAKRMATAEQPSADRYSTLQPTGWEGCTSLFGSMAKASNQWNNCCIHWSDCVFTSKSIKNQHDLTLICSFYPFFPQRSHRGLLQLPNGGEVLDDQALLAEADHLLLPVPRSDSAHPALRLRLPGLLPPPGLHYRRLRLQAACRPARVRHRRPRQGAV